MLKSMETLFIVFSFQLGEEGGVLGLTSWEVFATVL